MPVLFVEAYSSALAIAALTQRTNRQFLIVAMGGCWGWRGIIGKLNNEHGVRVDEKGPSPDLDHIAFGQRPGIICLDSNVGFTGQVQVAELEFKRELEKRGATVGLARIPAEPGVNGPDDYVGVHGDEEFLRILDNVAREAWPEPEQVRASLRPVEPLSSALIPEPFRPWLVDISERMGCPLDYVVVASIVVTGSVIGAGCGIRPKRKDDFTVVPNLWGGVLAGRVSC